MSQSKRIPSYKKTTILTVALASLALLPLSACGMMDLKEPTEFHNSKIQVRESQKAQQFSTTDVNDHVASQVAHHYRNHGEGDLYLTVTYNPKSNYNTASTASKELGRIIRLFKSNGIANIKGDIMPVNKDTEVSESLITYTNYTAHAPSECEKMMPGFDHHDTVRDDAYRMGCTFDTLLSRQIARPKDLLGNDGMDGSDARRQGNIIEPYRDGTEAQELDGVSLSEE